MSRLVPVAAFTLALVCAPGVSVRAEQGTHCTFEFEVNLSPGFSMTPTTGTHGGTGPITCHGPVNGHQPTGSGTLTDDGRYGTRDPDTCASGSEGDGTDTVEIPTAAGIVTLVSNFTYTAGDRVPTHGGMVAGSFTGSRFTGTIELTPLEGDCISKPVTKLRVSGEGILHG
jgi:hypothetical protein